VEDGQKKLKETSRRAVEKQAELRREMRERIEALSDSYSAGDSGGGGYAVAAAEAWAYTRHD
jgi:hypothetical protein